MSNVVNFAKGALDGILSNKARVAMALVAVAAVTGVKLSGPEADTLVTLAAFVVWVLEEAARMAAKAQKPVVTVTGPITAAPAASASISVPIPPAPVP